MRKYITLILFCLIVTMTFAQQRPKVAVVLAGGGAKGIAHITALKTIEEAGIPIDMVVGTSMGSIIGGMYCMGYSPDSMYTICGDNDWVQLIMDNPDYGDNSLTAKKENEKYLLRMSIDQERRSSDVGRGGVIAGRNVMRFFHDIMHGLPDSLDFNDLPIPFACVATNAVTGEMKVFHSGNMPRCIRASMAIPSVFTPIKIDGEVYIDGFVVDNFPVDVARQMGADIVIGVDLVTPTTDNALTNSAVDILLHCIDLVSMERYRKNIASCDIYMPIDVTGYSAASFTTQAIDTLLQRGEDYSQLKIHELDSLREKLNLVAPPLRTRIGEYSFATIIDHHDEHKFQHHIPTLATTIRHSYRNAVINLGGRFDNQEYAALQLGLLIDFNHRHNTLLNIKGRLGQRMGFMADLTTRTIGTQRMGFRYSFKHRELNYYQQGEKVAQVTSNLHDFQLYFSQVWHSVQYRFGTKYQMHHYQDVLTSPTLAHKPEIGWKRYWMYFLESEYNSLDQQYFPNSGQQLLFSANLLSDEDLFDYEGHTPFPILRLGYQSVFSLSDRFTIIPHILARAILSGNATCPWPMTTVVGGFSPRLQISHQLTMAGMPYMEVIPTAGVGIAGISARHRIFHNHYIHARADVATMANKLRLVLDSESLTWGVQAGYHVKTPMGPVNVDFHWNDHTQSFAVSFNAGYYF